MRTQQVSFELHGFWIHVNLAGSTGTDQHGDKWTLKNGKLYAEHSYHVIDIAPRYKDVNEEIDRMMEDERERRAS